MACLKSGVGVFGSPSQLNRGSLSSQSGCPYSSYVPLPQRTRCVGRAPGEQSAKSLERIRKFAEQSARRSGATFCVEKDVTPVVIKELAEHKDTLAVPVCTCRAYAYGDEIPTQAEAVTSPTSTVQTEFKSLPDLDYLQELLAIQQSGPRAIGFFGTRNMGFMHQQLIEILSYAMVITKNHIYTSGASGTNAAVIRGALRAERADLLTVILPQSLKMQPPESQELLSRVKNVVEMPHNDHLPLIEASRLCNMDILSHVQQDTRSFLACKNKACALQQRALHLLWIETRLQVDHVSFRTSSILEFKNSLGNSSSLGAGGRSDLGPVFDL